MLQKLYITNYAIIDRLEIAFSNHLNIITGETGAGKSIVLGAMGLILGDRADTGVLRDRQEKCVIEGIFAHGGKSVGDFLLANDLDQCGEIIVRREISPSGKSRAFINDTPATLAQLRQLSAFLVDLHQQFDTLELGTNDFQREVLDALAENGDLLRRHQHNFHQYREALRQTQELRQQQAKANTELDYNQYLFNELEEAGFRENEIEEAEEELRLMSNSENIKVSLSEVYFHLQEKEPAILQQMQQAAAKLGGVVPVFTAAEELHKRLQSAVIELEDIASEVQGLEEKVVYDAQKIEELNARITLGYHLMKKHHVTSTAGLLEVMAELETRLEQITRLDEEILAKEQETLRWREEAANTAAKISENRKKQLVPFSKQVNTLLQRVGMPNARIRVECSDGDLNSFGCNEIEFLFNANKSATFEPVRKVASGGELSRLMLIIKSLVAQKVQLPTLIFDEIDTGISGEAAKQVAAILERLAEEHQLIAVTHQPQIAARAHTHFFIHKVQKGTQIVTSVKVLSQQERITEIATMLAGSKPTAAAFENAREMMESGRGN